MPSVKYSTDLIMHASGEFSDSRLLREKFKHLMNTQFFVGPLDEVKAQAEFRTYGIHTYPTLVFKCVDGLYIVYP